MDWKVCHLQLMTWKVSLYFSKSGRFSLLVVAKPGPYKDLCCSCLAVQGLKGCPVLFLCCRFSLLSLLLPSQGLTKISTEYCSCLAAQGLKGFPVLFLCCRSISERLFTHHGACSLVTAPIIPATWAFTLWVQSKTANWILCPVEQGGIVSQSCYYIPPAPVPVATKLNMLV